MRVEAISARVLAIPLDRPFRSSLGWTIDWLGNVLVQARSNEGHVGTGYAFTLDNDRLPVLKAAIDSLTPVAVGRDPFEVRAVWRDMMTATAWFRPGGLIHFAIAAIDVALWDLLGKVTGKPLYLLLGGGRDQVPCYRPGFWRSIPTDKLSVEARQYRQEGFRAVKMKLGAHNNMELEIERVRVVREAIGDDVALMVDPNQAWSPDFAVKMGERLREYNPYWIEDPTSYADMDGRAKVAQALDIPIASGEEQFTRRGFLELIEHGAADIFNLDLQKLAGITGWLDVAAFLEARNLPFATHHAPEIQCHLLATTTNGLTIEFMPRSFALYREPPKVVNGMLQVPQGPGIGLDIDEEASKRFEMK